jgi:ribosomal protein L28
VYLHPAAAEGGVLQPLKLPVTIGKSLTFGRDRHPESGKEKAIGYAYCTLHKKAARSNTCGNAFGGLKAIALVRLRLSTKAIKTLVTKGLQAMAKETGINLNHY